MTPRTRNRSPEVEELVQRIRARRAAKGWKPTPFVPLPPLPPEEAAWLREFIDSGDLRRALDAVAADDPELAS